MRSTAQAITIIVLASLVGHAYPQDDELSKADRKRAEINTMARETLTELFEKYPNAESHYEEAYGYAVFEAIKVAIGISGGSGKGVAVAKGSGERTYMKMGTGGIGIGLGGQKYRVVFLFEDKETFDSFISEGWEADASAQAVAGTEGANAPATFNEGLSVYQMTKKGLMAHVDIAGTKYWINNKLNDRR